MSLALIQESAKEVRRLSIAGSNLAVGDFRLKKLVSPLEQAGAKVPVFAQVAKAINDLVNGTEAESAGNLLSLSTLINAILYTQGQSGADGDYSELPSHSAKSCDTKTSARVLKPLVQALTSTGSGRFEIVKSALERGAFNDLRLIEPSIRALDDVYPELADLVMEKILPAYGPGIAPLLKAKMDLKGKKCDARRLQVLHKLDPNGTVELCKTALEEGSPEVKAAAIGCLGKHEECLPLVLEQTNAKNKVLRAAALEALAEHDRPEVTKIFSDLIKGKALDILAGPFRALRNRQVLKSLIDEGQRVFEAVLKGDEDLKSRFMEILTCLNERKESEVEEFLLACMKESDKLLKLKSKKVAIGGDDIVDRLVALLYEIGSPMALEAILVKQSVLPAAAYTQVIYSALRTWPPGKVYEEFSPLLAEKKGAGKAKSEMLQHVIRVARGGFVAYEEEYYALDETDPESKLFDKVSWDPRWLDAAIKADLPVIVCCFAEPEHKGAITYLVNQAQDKKSDEAGLIIKALARCKYPKVTEAFLSAVSARTKKAKFFDYDLQFLLRSARFLPPADLPQLDAYAATLDEKFVDKFLEAIQPLRPTLSQSDQPTGPTP
jgi:HEAT repeats